MQEFPWGKETSDPLQSKFSYVCHAEVNAVLNKNSTDLKNCRLYVALFPCNECAKVIIQSRIKEIIYLSDKHAQKPEVIASKRMLDAAGIQYTQYVPACEKIVIDFTEIDRPQNFNQLPPTPIKKQSAPKWITYTPREWNSFISFFHVLLSQRDLVYFPHNCYKINNKIVLIIICNKRAHFGFSNEIEIDWSPNF